ncbi:helix-turn-helix domain-containing protein [Dyadobacter frigoris]|uniref:Helix-turn-helix domain-containing protein n=1 Tax=Dyadobacter frigoris TaxID=2576211 RepID=A0A4V6BIV5_9BACT|nr:helix-turn-helix domain-containing protein [Dyadobacter frigoris]TKT90573.1 helix-turn-helix domain-containing protein [Dyadobacter frigoris]GLU51284.1 AraC family transcriptional regulator [Dyadobacter frigoris]
MKKPESVSEYFGDKLPNAGSRFNIYECDDFRAKPVPYNRRDFYKITLQFGTSRLEYADKGILIDKPALLFTNPRIPYSWEPISEEQKGYFVLFTEEFLQDTNSDFAIENSPLFRLGADPVYYVSPEQVTYILQIFQNMHKEFHSDYVHKFELLRNHLNVLMHEAIKMQPVTNYLENQNASTRISSLFLELLDRQFPVDLQRPLTLRAPNQYAELLSVHVNHLNRALKEVTGKTTTEHLNGRIVLEAKALIVHTDWNIAEISHSLGYEYPTYFNNFFKKQTGSSPTLLREQNA